MYRLFSFLLIITGFVFLAFGSYLLCSSSSQEKARLSEAHELLSTQNQVSKESKKEDIQNLQYEMGKTIGLLYIPKLDRRSEEHTSELLSRGHLVCRLLLEKKNNN